MATPPVHPKDKNLLRPLAELGKPAFNAAGYSFLRRTEYISSEAKARAEASVHATRTGVKSSASTKPRKPVDAPKDDPMNMLRDVIKGFDIAYPEDAYIGPDNATNIRGSAPTASEMEAWKNPKHPSKPELKVLDSYSLKPDLDAITDSGTFTITKLMGNPGAATRSRDTRIDTGMLFPRDHDSGTTEYDFFLPATETVAANFRRKFDGNNADRENPELYTHRTADDVKAFRFTYLRTYDTNRKLDSVAQQYKEVALALHDDDDDAQRSQEKGAYYYPIVTKMQLKPRRKNLAQLGLASQAADDELEKIHWMNVTVQDPDEDELNSRARHREDMISDNTEVDVYVR